MIDFIDRESMRPGRYKVTTDAGESYFIKLERADEPTVVGTPLNAETFRQIGADIENDISVAVTGLRNAIANGTLVAAKATNATNAAWATNATSATNAANATKATNDSLGRNIANTYVTQELAAELGRDLSNEIDLRQDLEEDLRDGTIPVGVAMAVQPTVASMVVTNGRGTVDLLNNSMYVAEFAGDYNNYCGAFTVSQCDYVYFSMGKVNGRYNVRTSEFALLMGDSDSYIPDSGQVRFFRIGSLTI